MKILYAAVLLLISMGMFAQNMPIAIVDTVYGMEQTIIEIYPLLNDYDLDGDTLVIRYLYDGPGEAWFEDSTVYYKSRPGTGWEKIGYKAAEKQNFYSHLSNKAYMRINLQDNPDIPVAVKDSLHAKYLEPTILYPLHNDYDPNGDPIKIHEIDYSPYLCDVEVSEDSTYVIVTSEYAYFGYASFDYSIIEVNTDNEYISHESYVRVYLDENENLPIAVNDTMTVTGGIPTILDVLENDHDPSGDTLEFFDIDYPWNANLSIENNTITLTADTSFTGETEFEYSIRYKNNPGLYSQSATVKIFVGKNPDCPTGEPDYGSGMAYTYIPVQVLGNDHDPNGDDFEIKDVWMSDYGMGASISFSGDTVIYRTQPGKIGPDSCFYRIMKSNNPAYYSEPIPIRYDIEWNPGYPKTFPDSARVKGGQEVLIDFRSNDIIQDSIIINFIHSHGSKLGISEMYSDSLILYKAFSRSHGRDTIQYYYRNFGFGTPFECEGEIYIEIENSHAYDSLTVNNINAGFNASGFQFSRINEIINENTYGWVPHFEAPNESCSHTMFCHTIWIGGVDESGMLHIGAERYRQYGIDFQPGPVYGGEYDSIYFQKWNRIWKLNASDISFHYHNWWKEDYEPIEPIASWPGNGEGNGMAEQLAPYFDKNSDGIYDPLAGDYPLIRGDQCLFFITNDDKVHSESQGLPLRTEIHWMAYAFDAPEDSILNNTIFVHYDLINRSELTYYDVYFGNYTDFDLGYSWDDYIGSHVSGNSYYAYNDEIDGDGGSGSYGDNPPAQSVTFLAGPYIDPDNIDNPTGECDEGILGLNFGNGIIDDERHGISYFVWADGGGGPQGPPIIADEYYWYLQGLWKDQTPFLFGGAGHFWSGAVGPECRYMFPGDSDPENWGTACLLPNDGYNQDGKWWTDITSNNNSSDRNAIGSSGPFTFNPGDVQEVDMAYVFANSYYSADSSVKLLGERLLELRQRTLDGEIIIPNNELNINEERGTRNEIHIYPNPARELIYIKGAEELADAEYRIYNMMGTSVQNGNIDGEISISRLQKGFYIMRIISGNGISVAKFIKN